MALLPYLLYDEYTYILDLAHILKVKAKFIFSKNSKSEFFPKSCNIFYLIFS